MVRTGCNADDHVCVCVHVCGWTLLKIGSGKVLAGERGNERGRRTITTGRRGRGKGRRRTPPTTKTTTTSD